MREMVLEKYLCSYSIDIRIVRSEGFACIYLTKSPPVILDYYLCICACIVHRKKQCNSAASI